MIEKHDVRTLFQCRGWRAIVDIFDQFELENLDKIREHGFDGEYWAPNLKAVEDLRAQIRTLARDANVPEDPFSKEKA